MNNSMVAKHIGNLKEDCMFLDRCVRGIVFQPDADPLKAPDIPNAIAVEPTIDPLICLR